MHGVGSFEIEIKQTPGAGDFQPPPRLEDRTAGFIGLADKVGDGAVMFADN